MPENEIRSIIVDDDAKSRLLLRKFLEAEPYIRIIGECSDGREALEVISRLEPHLVFLDIEMPDMDGFEMLEMLQTDKMPFVVFVTAYDQYAIKAFEFHALDYILKPFDRSRLSKTMTWIRRKFEDSGGADIRKTVMNLLEEIRREKERDFLTRLVVKKDERYFFLNIEQVFWIESNKNYVNVYTANDTYTYRNSISAMESRLNPERFLKINRFSIVNLDCIREIQEIFKGDLMIILKNNTRLTISRRNRKKLKEFMA